MSFTVRQIRDRVIEQLQDFDRSKSAYSAPQYDIAIKGVYQVLWAKMPFPHVYQASGLTIGPLSDTFVLATNLGSDISLRIQSSGQFLRKIDANEMDAFRSGGINVSQSAYVPSVFTLWNEPGIAGTDLHGRCWPPARAAEVCDVYFSRIPPELVGPTLDAENVLFDTDAAEALINKVAADLLDRLPDDEVAKLKLNPKIARKWDKDSELLIYRAASTRHDIEHSGRTQRWVP